MHKIAFNLKVASVISVVSLISVGLLGTSTAFADQGNTPVDQPVTISAVCQDAEGDTAAWRVGNPNPNAATLTWATASSSDSVSVPYGYTNVNTYYDPSANPPHVTFHQDGQSDQILPVSDTACVVPENECVDGLVRANLTFQWSIKGIVTVSTANGMPLCDDVTVYLSSYTLPATYDGSGVFDDSSIPQKQFSSTNAFLQKGTSGDTTLQITVPNACTDYQLDLYYAPEVKVVSYHGHGAQLIYGDISLHTPGSCTKPGGHGGGHTLGSSTTRTLADTGSNTVIPAVSAIMLMLAAVLVNFSILARAKLLFSK